MSYTYQQVLFVSTAFCTSAIPALWWDLLHQGGGLWSHLWAPRPINHRNTHRLRVSNYCIITVYRECEPRRSAQYLWNYLLCVCVTCESLKGVCRCVCSLWIQILLELSQVRLPWHSSQDSSACTGCLLGGLLLPGEPAPYLLTHYYGAPQGT